MEKRKESKNWLEWTVTIISTLIVAGVIGVLVYQMVAENDTPPNIHISLGKVAARNDYFSIPVTVRNDGDLTAQNLKIEFSLGDGANGEKSLVEFDYLPGSSKATGWISFSTNPEGKAIKSHILGYTVP